MSLHELCEEMVMPVKAKGAERVVGFTEGGRRYVMRDVHAMESADSFLWNDAMFYRIDHRGRSGYGHTSPGGPFFLQPNDTQYSRPWRCVYVRDDVTGKIWSAPFDPCQVEPDEFEFAPGISDIRWRNVTDGIEVTLRLALPVDDAVELWTVTARNLSKKKRKISLYPFMPIGILSALRNSATWDDKLGGIKYEFFPYYVAIEDYYKNTALKNAVFCVPDRKPTSWDANMVNFQGGGLAHNPASLANPRLGKSDMNSEDGCAAFQYAIELAPGKSFQVNLVAGPAKDFSEMLRLKRKYLKPGAIDRAIVAMDKFQRDLGPKLKIETPDGEWNHFINHWLPKQALWVGRTFRSSYGPCARNAITDAMGGIYLDPKRSREWFLGIWSQQELGGWIAHGLVFAENVRITPINTIPHRDMNIWGPQALYTYVTETGDYAILDEKIPFSDDKRNKSLYEHINIGLEWQLKDRSKRGLSLIGQGDWCDPLNMAGPKLKGESIMLTMNLVWALDIWSDIAEHRGDAKLAARYRKEADKCRKAINRFAWDGKWYIRGTTDAGKPFGSSKNKEGKIWVNPQGWSIITRTASPTRQKLAIASVEKHLITPNGPLMNAPPYTRFYNDIGKVTIKNPGINENGAPYNSACCWWAFAMFKARLADKGWTYMRRILAGDKVNTIERAQQLPLYVPNYYYGPAVGKSQGLSSHAPSTGTAPWLYHTAISQFMGLRGEFGGLRIDPQLPSAWKRSHASYEFQGARFEIEIVRSKKVKKTTVVLDGKELRTNLVPFQPKGTKHKVTVTIP